MRTPTISDKLYLAGPWFTPEAMETQIRIEQIAANNGWHVFSPRIELTLNKDSTPEDHRRCFTINNMGLRKCKLIIANVEGYDTGTLWEMGAAYAYGTPLVIYSPNPQRRLNVMLSQSCEGFLAGWEKVEQFLTPKNTTFTWDALEKWNKEVF